VSPLGYPLEPGSKTASDAHPLRFAVDSAEASRLYEVCHDMRQSVACIIALADASLCHTAIPTSICARLGQIRDQAEWLGDLLSYLADPGRPESDDVTSLDLNCLVSEVVHMEKATYLGELVLHGRGCELRVLGNGIELRRAIVNLLNNATRAAGPGGKVIIELRRTADQALLTIDDSGPGFGLISRGYGLGLQAVARGLKSYGGVLEYGDSQLGGVRAILVLKTAKMPCEVGYATGHL
jgi:signal transduction histidine kinase